MQEIKRKLSIAEKALSEVTDLITTSDLDNKDQQQIKKQLTDVNAQLQKITNEDLDKLERQKLAKYIFKRWTTCKEMRAKMDTEGVENFYKSYTKVPVSRNLYHEFADSEACYCGGGCVDVEDEDDEEDNTIDNDDENEEEEEEQEKVEKKDDNSK